MNSLQKYINVYTLGLINLGIIFGVEFSGKLFFDTGYIHLVAILFALIAVVFYRAAKKQLFSDNYLKTYFKLDFIILIIFSVVHLLEYFISIKILPLEYEAGDAFVLFSYMACILLIIGAGEYLLGLWRRKSESAHSKWIFKGSLFLSAFFICFSFYFLLVKHTDEQLASITTPAVIFIFIIGIFAMVRIAMLKKVISILSHFIDYFSFTILFVMLSSVFEFFEAAEIEIVPGADIQNTYITHFLIYIAISFYILGLTKLLTPGGVYKDINESLSQ